MADDTERLFVQLEARITDFEKRMKKAERTGTNTYNKLQRGSRSATRQMERDMQRSTARINQALASTSTQVGLFAKSFALGVVGGGSIAGFVSTVKGVVSELSEMGKQMDRVGLSAKVFQELQYGFSLAGVAQSDFITGMEQFTKRIGEASMGTGRLFQILEANGVSLRKRNGELKSTETLLREYAELIRNAGSEQERMTLATEAFGRGGASFVNALKNGEQGLRDMEKATADAGGTIDEKLIRKAEKLDDEWGAMWHNFEINAKSAIMSAISYLDRLQDKTNEFGNNSFFKWLSEKAGTNNAVFVPGEGVYNPGSDELSPSARVAAAFQGEMQKADADLVEALKQRYGEATSKAAGDKKTVLPTTGGSGGSGTSRNREAAAAIRQAEAVRDLIKQLEFEQSLIGMSEVEREKAITLRRANVDAASEEGVQIGNLVERIHAETEALRLNEEAQEARAASIESLFQMGGDALESIVSGSMKAEDAIKKLAVQLALAAAQAALLGTGPLAGLLGGGLFGGGGISSTAMSAVMGGAGGLYFNGTANTGGQKGEPRGIVHGQEAVIPLPDGGKVPVQVMGEQQAVASASTVDVRLYVDQDGNWQAEVEKISQSTTRAAFKDYEKGTVARVARATQEAQRRRML